MAGLLVAHLANAQWQPRRLVDFESTPHWTSVLTPGSPAELPNGDVLLEIYDDDHGAELWLYDGSAAQLLRDLVPGPESSDLQAPISHGGLIYFAGTDRLTGYELWRSDGTVAGTVQVSDLNPGPSSSGPGHLTSSGDRLFFSARDASSGRELHVLDGDGLIHLIDLVPGSEGPSFLWNFVSDGVGGIYFEAASSLWHSDGTVLGTRRLEDPMGDSRDPDHRVVVISPTLVAFLDDDDLVLWDAVAADFEVLMSGVRSRPVLFDDHLFFVGEEVPTGRELYVWPITGSSPPALHTDLNPGSADAFPSFGSRVEAAGDFLLAYADDGQGADREIWYLESAAGTLQLTGNLDPFGDLDIGFSPFLSDGVNAYFVATPSFGGCTAWRISAAGTASALSRPNCDSIQLFGATEGRVWLTLREADSQRIWTLQSSSFTSIAAQQTRGADFGFLGPGRNSRELFGSVSVDGLGFEPWRAESNGSSELLADVVAGELSSGPISFGVTEQHLSFVPFSPASQDPHIWDENGIQIAALNFPAEGTARILATFGSDLLVSSLAPGEPSSQLFLLDPATRNAVQLTSGGSLGPLPRPLIDAHSIWFSYDGFLWRSDGTVAGTQVVHPTLAYGNEGIILPDSGDLLFSSGEAPPRLFRTDGTEQGTQLLSAQRPDGLDFANLEFARGVPASGRVLLADQGEIFGTSAAPDDLVALPLDYAVRPQRVDGGWMFVTGNETVGSEVGFTDGTIAGTRLLDLWPGPGSSTSGTANIVSDGSTAYFSAFTPARGHELWRSNGTELGTEPLPDVGPGTAGIVVDRLLAWGGYLYGAINGGDGSGTELWFFDVSDLFIDGFESGDASAWSSTTP